jgi:hypothetical protein
VYENLDTFIAVESQIGKLIEGGKGIDVLVRLLGISNLTDFEQIVFVGHWTQFDE